ncbi:hypothetical protein IE81DRAFT_209163 [Ceraceosorus guamensis]|uniref:Phosphatidylethanolamine N-methyltransferase n=1 Tax=Ceraceosorus guamensis TaxID=1522189 RepID=A0A316WBD7_9BASI|nr:hypothetical protein IE81DRAFT_209163 [Ceraceosorus guamensis]PWN45243.1 hypothetical protein IE81DRAFT_209163 [Ceraceosorus guamensis]
MSATGVADKPEGLRQRANASSSSDKTSSSVPQDAEQKGHKVLGRTSDGTVFEVPETPDMLTSIFSPYAPKTPLDILTIVSLSAQVLLFFALSRSSARIVFACYFAFWRAAYNAGLGWVLKQQSEHNWIVKIVKREGWMDKKSSPKMEEAVRKHLKAKMGKGYKYEKVPIEYNIWLLFRSIVDVILLNDFTAYSLFAFSCTRLPEGHSAMMHVLRWAAGWTLIFFNLWVKMDAHRVVKDYAWYWGDCFFLCLQSLVFDGVYELAPHVMYSIGYAGYYGLSLVSGSYAVLFVSLAAHASQFAFLMWFETPHIDRVYGEKKPLAARVPLRTAPYNAASADAAKGRGEAKRPRADSDALPSPRLAMSPLTGHSGDLQSTDDDDLGHSTDLSPEEAQRMRFQAERESRTRATNLHDLHHKIFKRDVVVFKNLDPLRGSDFQLIVASFYALVPFLLPTSRLGSTTTLVLAYLNALAWRAFHSGGLGLILSKQSQSKWMVRHFLKHYSFNSSADAVYETFDSWKIIYNTSLVMTYISYGILCWKCYVPLGSDWQVGTDLLRHVLGVLLIALHVWAAHDSYNVLGPFGWLYGDFFIDEFPHQLHSVGIFRFLNSPERSVGQAAFFGLSLISGSKLALSIAILSHAAHWAFLSLVENPHMRKLYGEAALSREGGVTKQLKGAATRNAGLFRAAQDHPRVREMRAELERVQKDASNRLEDFGARFDGMVKDTRTLLQQGRDRLLIVRTGEDISTIDTSLYNLEVQPSAAGNRRFYLGEPISVKWRAPSTHSRRDWIGIYQVSRLGGPRGADGEQALVTRISSHGKWVGVAEDEWDGDVHNGALPLTPSAAPSGEVEKSLGTPALQSGTTIFKGAKLPWQEGIYEIRYHHDAKHNVLARSSRLEIYVDKPADPTSFDKTYAVLGKIVLAALDNNNSYAPRSQTGRPQAESMPEGRTSDEDPDDFTIWDRAQAKRIASGIQQAFDVDYSVDVVVAVANLRKLAHDIVEARQILDPNFRPTLLHQ